MVYVRITFLTYRWLSASFMLHKNHSQSIFLTHRIHLRSIFHYIVGISSSTVALNKPLLIWAGLPKSLDGEARVVMKYTGLPCSGRVCAA